MASGMIHVVIFFFLEHNIFLSQAYVNVNANRTHLGIIDSHNTKRNGVNQTYNHCRLAQLSKIWLKIFKKGAPHIDLIWWTPINDSLFCAEQRIHVCLFPLRSSPLYPEILVVLESINKNVRLIKMQEEIMPSICWLMHISGSKIAPGMKHAPNDASKVFKWDIYKIRKPI